MRRAPTHGVVCLAALDLRRRPDHRSEMRSQLLMGETVRILARARAGTWLQVENRSDRYRGWVRSWGLVETGAARATVWLRRARARVVRLYAEVREAPGRGPLVAPLPWGARVIPLGRRGRHRRVELPDGRTGWVEVAALGGVKPGPARGLIARVRSLLGAPYLWGGRTPLGIDCSGFTQLVLAEIGVPLPRDAAQQERHARTIGRHASPRPGDLAFFGGRRGPAAHVGLLLGGGYYAHARGRVRINSLDPNNPLYDKQLGAQLRSIRRSVIAGKHPA